MRRARDRALAEDPGAAVIRPEHFERRASPTGASSASASPPSSRPVRSALAVAEMLPALTADLPIDPEELDDGWRRLTREREQLDDHERQLIRLALDKHRGVISHAARELGVRRTSLISRMGTLGIDR